MLFSRARSHSTSSERGSNTVNVVSSIMSNYVMDMYFKIHISPQEEQSSRSEVISLNWFIIVNKREMTSEIGRFALADSFI